MREDISDENKIYFSERKVIIHEPCVLCGMGKCNQRLVCAHPTHLECFLRNNKSPKCKICESKNDISL